METVDDASREDERERDEEQPEERYYVGQSSEEASYTCGVCGVIDWDLPDALMHCEGTCRRRLCWDCRASNSLLIAVPHHICQQCYAEAEAEDEE